MKIGLVGGVFSRNGEFQEFQSAPEYLLLDALIKNGQSVETFPLAGAQKPKGDVDVFHAHHFGLASYYLGCTKLSPLVFTSHNPFVASRYPVKIGYLERKLMKITLKNADAVVALSGIEAQVLKADFNVDIEKIHIIPNGLKVDLYNKPMTLEKRKKQFENKTILLFVGQLAEFKGVKYLLKALKEVVVQEKDIVLIISSYNPQLIQEYKDFCQSHSLIDHVIFLGKKSMKELIALYHLCDVYIQPSLAECLPTVITEAMMCGKPVIATNVGGIPEQITENTGILIKPMDSHALANAIIELIKDEGMRREMGMNGKKRVLEKFTQEQMYKKHLKLYEEVKSIRTHRSISILRAFPLYVGLEYKYFHTRRYSP